MQDDRWHFCSSWNIFRKLWMKGVFSHKKNNTQSMIVGDWKTTRFAWNTFHQWWSHCVFGQKLTIDDCGWLKATRLAWNIFEQWWSKYVFWQRKKYQTIDDCSWLKTCTPCMEYFRLIAIKWCFFGEKEYAVAAHKIFPKKMIEGCCRRKLGEVWLVSCWCTCLQTLSLSFFAFQQRRSLLFQSQIGW